MSTPKKARLIAPSGAVRVEVFTRGTGCLEALGIPYDVVPGELSKEGYFAGTDAARAARVESAIRDAEGPLWMIRGGYGAIRTLEALGDDWKVHEPVPLWGFSDGTALLAAWIKREWPAWHVPPVIQLPRLDEVSLERLRLAWFEGEVPAIEDLEPLHEGWAQAPLSGGNLCVLSSLIGTPYAANHANTILLLEDVGEPAYKVNRMVTQLLYAGAFKGVVGIVAGAFTEVPDVEVVQIRALFEELAETLNIPVAWGFPSGHGTRHFPVPFGRGSGFEATLEVGATQAEVRFHRD